MRFFSNLTSNLSQKVGVSVKEKKLSPIMQLIKKYKFFKMTPFADGYKVTLGEHSFFIFQEKTSVRVSLLDNNIYKKADNNKNIKSSALELLIDFSLILFSEHFNIPVKIYTFNTYDESYLWQFLRKKKRDLESINTEQKNRFAHWEKLTALSSVSLKSLNFDIHSNIRNTDNVIAALQIEGEQIIRMIDFTLLYSDWTINYDNKNNTWNIEVYGKKILGIQEGEWQALMMRAFSVLELGAAELLAKLSRIMHQGSKAPWMIYGENKSSIASLSHASWLEGATLETEIHKKIEAFIQDLAVSTEKEIELLAEQGAAVVSNQVLDHILFGFDKGERSYQRQSAKKKLLDKSWLVSQQKLKAGDNTPENDDPSSGKR